MAIENAKNLNVRIKNKYDKYENWAQSSLVLEAGEIAIAYTTVDVKVDNGTAKHPALLMKVGDGTSTFANLPWMSAKAADVLEACKSTDGLTAFVNEVIADAGIATNDAMEALAAKVGSASADGKEATGLYARIETAEGAIDALEALVGDKSVADQIKSYVDGLNLGDTYAAKTHTHTKSEITDFDHTHTKDEITDFTHSHTKSEITDFAHNHEMEDINGLSNEFGKKVDKEDGKSLVADTEIARLAAMKDGANKVEKSDTNGNIKIDGTDVVVYTHPAEHAISEITGLQDALDELDRLVGDDTVANQIDGALKVDGAEKYALSDHTHAFADLTDKPTTIAGYGITDAYTKTEVDKAVSDAKSELIGVSGDAADANTIHGAKKYADDAIAAMVKAYIADEENPESPDAIDKLTEIATWIADDDAGAAKIVSDVKANTEAIEVLNGDDDGSVNKKIADAIAGENLSQYAKAADLTALAGKVGTVADGETVVGMIGALETLVGETPVASQISTAIDGALMVGEDGAKTEKYALATDLAAVEEEIGTASVEGGPAATGLHARIEAVEANKVNDADLAAIAKSGSTDDLVQGELVLVFDCGGSGVTA